MDDLSQALDKLISLQEINLRFQNCKGISDSGIVQLSQSLNNFVNLQCLILQFDYCNEIKYDGINAICQAVKNMVPLNRFLFYLRGNSKLTQKQMDYLMQILSSLPNLRNIRSCFSVQIAKVASF